MFRDAVELASRFTFPVVLSRRTVSGTCSSSIGAFVVVNSAGWIITAGHMVEQLAALGAEAAKVTGHEAKEAAIRADTSLSPKERQKALSRLGHLDPQLTRNSGAWWGLPDPSVQLISSKVLSEVDVAVGQLSPFDPAWVTAYPKFKDPSTEVKAGTSVCKFGFPFHSFTPYWNAATSTFEFPPGAVPLPGFSMDGIVTKVVPSPCPTGPAPAYPWKWVVSSTPGLRGQSGGPTFDVRGVVYAIQARTMHLALGFDPEVPGKPGTKEHQFLNVGLGVHPETFAGLFNELGVTFSIAPD